MITGTPQRKKEQKIIRETARTLAAHHPTGQNNLLPRSSCVLLRQLAEPLDARQYWIDKLMRRL